MELSQKVALAFIGLVICEAFVFLALTANLVDGVDANCDPGTVCARPTREIETLIGSVNAETLSHDQFTIAKVVIVAAIIITQVAIVKTTYNTARAARPKTLSNDEGSIETVQR